MGKLHGIGEHAVMKWRKMSRPGQFGPVLAFGHKGGIEGGEFHRQRETFSHLANVGDAKTLVIHPASRHQPPRTRRRLRVTHDFIRVSVGIEHIDDIIADFDQALNV